MKIKHTVGDVFSNREGKIRSVTSLRIGVYGVSSLSTMIYAAKEAQLDGTLNICTPWIDNDS